ncbi:MAG TPA: hypothetical protein VFD58_25990 [Blastocatellia bacterium]|nr:hypothetical protein [Blastocatellia bacterium]
MIASRITPRVVIFGLVAQLALWLAMTLPTSLGLMPRYYLTSWFFRTGGSCIGFALALALNLEVAAEYRNTRWLRVAWLALAANAGISIFRMIFEGPLPGLVLENYSTSPLRGLLQHLAIVPANLALLVGVIAMCQAYHQVGLGFEIERRDYAVMIGIAAVLTGLMTFREGLTEAQSPYLTSRYLQQSGLVLLALVSAVSVVLHRMAMQMGGGRLALALRVLTLYALSRSVLVLLGAVTMPLTGPVRSYFLVLAWQAVAWLPALAAAYRAQLTVNAAKELARLEQGRMAQAAAVAS